jgi:hypothetical protein
MFTKLTNAMMTNYIKIATLSACLFVLSSCNDADNFDYSKEVLVMTGTEDSPIVSFVVEDTPSSYPVTVSATGKVTETVNVDLKVDNSLVDKYNREHKTSYYALPESAFQFKDPKVTIETGKAASDPTSLTLTSTEDFVDGRIYIIPVTITNVQGGKLSVLESSRTIYLRISRVVEFNSLDIRNTDIYSNFIFDDALAVDLPNYTYEIKCYINDWHTSPEQISRLCQWTSKSESRSNMLRFGENGQDINSLQWVTPAGNIISKTRFATKSWYTLSFTFDGSTLAMYVNGVKDAEMSGSGETNFQRFELGMSWESYPAKQYFNGRVAEVRVWNRALSASEIQLGTCGVDTASEGLVAYWKINEGEGHIFHDATGHGYDMDWSKTVRDDTGNGTLNEFDKSSAVEQGWVFDNNNKCSN